MTESCLQRPDTALVQAYWKEFLAIWEVASEVERGKLMPLIVERVELTEKERDFCRLEHQPEIPRPHDFSTSGNVVVNSPMGAAGEVIAINPPLPTTHNFPPIELDYDIIRPKRVMHGRFVTALRMTTVV